MRTQVQGAQVLVDGVVVATHDSPAAAVQHLARIRVAMALRGEFLVEARDFSAEERRRMAKNHQAMPDGSFPTPSKSDWYNARQALGRTSEAKRHAVRRYLKRRGKALGIPEEEYRDL